MSCDHQFHEELKSMEEYTCPFSDQLLVEVDKAVELCCSKRDMENVNGMNVCLNCGSVHSYDYLDEYIDFYDNMCWIRRKSRYYRTYHLYNKIDFLSRKHGVQILKMDMNKIVRVFDEIDEIKQRMNVNIKRIININYIFKKLFNMLNIPIGENITLSKSKKTLASYEQYWEDILLLIGDRINAIINR